MHSYITAQRNELILCKQWITSGWGGGGGGGLSRPALSLRLLREYGSEIHENRVTMKTNTFTRNPHERIARFC